VSDKLLAPAGTHLLLPVLPLREVSLFPEASLALVLNRAWALRALEMANRMGGHLVAVAQRDPGVATPQARDLHGVGTLAQVTEDVTLTDGGRRVEMDGIRRARLVETLGAEVMVAEVELLDEGSPEDEWGSAVEALARYMHAHADLRSFLDQQRRSQEAMAWVNLACQHLPITASARQKLLESDARERCLRIGRGMDALLRKEKHD